MVLAVYAHPDDADVACAGSLARWAKAGGSVHLVVCTDGGKGTYDPEVDPVGDWLRSAPVSCGRRPTWSVWPAVDVLGYPDGELTDSAEFRRTLVERVRALRPDVVCGHDPTAVFFGRSYFNHRDHRIAGAALLDAVAPAAALPHYFPEAGPPHQVATVLLTGTLEPDEWVDVSDTIDTKVAAVECHRSQFAGQEGWAGEAVRRRAAEEGRRAGVACAEGFRRLNLGG